MSKAKHDPNHDTHKERHTGSTEITYPSTTRTFTSNDAFLNHQRATAIRMGSRQLPSVNLVHNNNYPASIKRIRKH